MSQIWNVFMPKTKKLLSDFFLFLFLFSWLCFLLSRLFFSSHTEERWTPANPMAYVVLTASNFRRGETFLALYPYQFSQEGSNGLGRVMCSVPRWATWTSTMTAHPNHMEQKRVPKEKDTELFKKLNSSANIVWPLTCYLISLTLSLLISKLGEKIPTSELLEHIRKC